MIIIIITRENKNSSVLLLMQTGSTYGTFSYMSPEMLRAVQSNTKPKLNQKKSDIYSLGMLYIFIHCGKDMVEKICDEIIKPAELVETEMKALKVAGIIKEMLQENSRDRPTIECVKLFIDAQV